MIAVTTYYNPCSYETRRNNFKTFKANLGLPLLTIELSFNGQFELTEGDSDFLVRVNGSSVLWQKERLLNIALDNLPAGFEYIAWLDCDLIFEDDHWVERSIELLNRYKIVQPFSELVDLQANFDLEVHSLKKLSPNGFSISFLKAEFNDSIEDFRPQTTERLRKAAFGLAWVSSIKVIRKHGFYDAMIIGSGDRAMACAAYGQFSDFVYTTKLNKEREKHYLEWAIPFYTEINGNVGYLKTRLYHLWHGNIRNRNYIERHNLFAQFDFDPFKDIVVNEEGCWELKNKNEELNSFFVNYFASRKEDSAND